MKISLCASFMILYINLVESDGKYNALIFDRFGKALIEVPNELPKYKNCGYWASACPAENNEDKNFNTKESINGDALFVKKTYGEDNTLTDLKVQICDQPFKLSIAMFEQRPHLYFEFGYEIYFKKSMSEKFMISDKGMYVPLKDILNFSRPAKNILKIFIPTKGNKKSRAKEAPINEDEEKSFTWIPLFKAKIRHRKVQRVEYDIRKNNVQPMVQCKDYSLGQEMYNNINVDEFYSQTVQEKMLKTVKLRAEVGDACKKSYKCFEKWSLIPTDQFQFGSTELPSCSGITTVPVWSSKVIDVLKKVDDYLYALSRVSGKPLRIISGISKYLKLSSNKWWLKRAVAFTHKGITLYVPKIIYKIVRFKITNACKNEDGCWYGVMILIHNDPNFDKDEHHVCIGDRSSQLGWEEITKYGNPSSKGGRPKSEFVYVCPVRSDTMEQVGLTYPGMLPVSELSLKQFPYLRSTQINDLDFDDLRGKILQELISKSSQKGESKESAKKAVVERPLIDDDNFELQFPREVEAKKKKP